MINLDLTSEGHLMLLENIRFCFGILLLFVIIILFYHGYFEASNNASGNTKNDNQFTSIDNYVIKYFANGGFTGRHDYIWYNSTTNHLISNYKANISVYELGLDDALFDRQLSHNQQKNLSNQVTNGNLLNISFNNSKPDCCDISYYRLELKTATDVNSMSWTSGNILDHSSYMRLPPAIIKIVDTVEQYTTNSTILFSESRVKQ
jgi:hypothetical protein